MKKLLFALSAAAIMTFGSCTKGDGINIFTIQDDIELGRQTKQQIESDPAQFPIMSPAQYPQQYTYLRAIVQDILDKGEVKYKDEFDWEIHIIDSDIKNAFCTPGGYMYVYTGLIKYLDSVSSLAGVIGHEMAHADKRHSTKLLTQKYGVQTLLDVILGQNQNLLTQIGSELIALRFGRSEESQADEYSVIYLCPTKYKADGAADFFDKMSGESGSNIPEFLSTHPNPENRVENIRSKSNSLTCTTTISPTEEYNNYQQFKNSLP